MYATGYETVASKIQISEEGEITFHWGVICLFNKVERESSNTWLSNGKTSDAMTSMCKRWKCPV